MTLTGIHHIALIASDYQMSKRFYTGVLGLSIIKETYRKERESYKLDLALNGSYVIELFSFPNYAERPTMPEATGLRHLAFSVGNIEEARDELMEKGVEVQEIRTDEITGKRFCFFFDPDRQPLELYEG